MIKIAEKPWFYEDRAVKVCTQAVTGRRQEPKKSVFSCRISKHCLEKDTS